jgi:hypothetical protein
MFLFFFRRVGRGGEGALGQTETIRQFRFLSIR